MNWTVVTFDDLVSFWEILFDNRLSALQPERTKTNEALEKIILNISKWLHKYHIGTIKKASFEKSKSKFRHQFKFMFSNKTKCILKPTAIFVPK